MKTDPLFDIAALGRSWMNIQPKQSDISDEKFGEVYDGFRTANLEIIEQRRKQGQLTRQIFNVLAVPVIGRMIQIDIVLRLRRTAAN